MKKTAFTIVELIIVILIFIILSSIGYLAYGSHVKTVRDNNRVNQIQYIGDGIDLQLSKGKNIQPENAIEIYVEGEKYSTQGEAGQKVLGESGFIGKGLDPKDNEYYIFSLSSNSRDYEMMTFLEEQENLPKTLKEINLIGIKTPYIYGKNSIGILLDDLGTPLNKVLTGTVNIDCNIDLGYKMIFQDGRILESIVVQSEFENGPCYIKPSNGCLTQPDYENAVYNVGTPISPNQEWIKGDITESCSYSCINGYTGLFCENP